MKKPKYDAFISYSHGGDSHVAKALEAGLQRFAKPVFQRRGLRVFRDQSDLSLAPHLWGKIQEALSASDYFLLLASPEAAASSWVEKELELWMTTKGAERILIVQTAGELVWDEAAGDFDWEQTTSLPVALRSAFEGAPLYLDLRWAREGQDLDLKNEPFKHALAQVTAAIREQTVEQIYGEELRQHRRTIRLRNWAIALLSVLTLVSMIAAGVAVNQSRIAERQRQAAADSADAERKAREFANTQRQAAESSAEAERNARAVADTQRQRAERSAEAEREAREATQRQLAFVTEVFEDQLELRYETGKGLLLLRIPFDFEGFDLKPAPRERLRLLATFLRSQPTIQVSIEGHAAEFNTRGESLSPEYALSLSASRSRSVSEYLMSLGVPGVPRTVGRGSDRPLIEAKNPEQRVNVLVHAINHRAEVYAVW